MESGINHFISSINRRGGDMLETIWKPIGVWIQTKPVRSLLWIIGGVLILSFWGQMEGRRADRHDRHASALCENLKLIDLDEVKAEENAQEGYEAMKLICQSRSRSVVAIIQKQ